VKKWYRYPFFSLTPLARRGAAARAAARAAAGAAVASRRASASASASVSLGGMSKKKHKTE